MNALSNIFSRVSTREFTANKVAEEDLRIILQAAMAAPVGRGRYDNIHLTLITNEELLDEIATAEDYSSARPNAPLYGAPALIIVSAKLSEKPSIEYSNVGAIIQTMALAAGSLSLGSIYLWTCIASLENHPEIVAKFNLPEDFTPISALGVGYPEKPIDIIASPRHQINVNTIR